MSKSDACTIITMLYYSMKQCHLVFYMIIAIDLLFSQLSACMVNYIVHAYVKS